MFNNEFNFYTGSVRLISQSNEYIGTEGPHAPNVSLSELAGNAPSPGIIFSGTYSHLILVKFDRIYDGNLNPGFRFYLPFDWTVQNNLELTLNQFINDGAGFSVNYRVGFLMYLMLNPFEFTDIKFTDNLTIQNGVNVESTHEFDRHTLNTNVNIFRSYVNSFSSPLNHLYAFFSSRRIYGFALKPYLNLTWINNSDTIFNLNAATILNMKLGPKPFITL
jgi:hypothetical protein